MQGIGIAVLAFILCCINVTGWLVFLRKFKRLFSTDNILRKTRQEVSLMIDDVNRTTARNLDLIEEKIKHLKAASADAERHIAVAKDELEKQVKINQLQSVLSSKKSAFPEKKETENPAGEGRSQSYENLSDSLRASMAYEITSRGKRTVAEAQGELFSGQEADDKNEKFVKSPSGTKFMIDNEGAGVAVIPKIGGNIIFSDNPVTPKKTINQQIKELFDLGYDVEMTARELGLTTTEVQFARDMDFFG